MLRYQVYHVFTFIVLSSSTKIDSRVKWAYFVVHRILLSVVYSVNCMCKNCVWLVSWFPTIWTSILETRHLSQVLRYSYYFDSHKATSRGDLRSGSGETGALGSAQLPNNLCQNVDYGTFSAALLLLKCLRRWCLTILIKKLIFYIDFWSFQCGIAYKLQLLNALRFFNYF